MKKSLLQELLSSGGALRSHKTLIELARLGRRDLADVLLSKRRHLMNDDLCVPTEGLDVPAAYVRKSLQLTKSLYEDDDVGESKVKVHLFVENLGSVGAVVQLTEGCSRHAKARRVSLGEKVILFDGRGNCLVGALGPSSVAVDHRFFVPPRRERIVVASAIPEAARLEVLVGRAAELGASAFQPIMCERSVHEKFDPARLERIVHAACEQSKRAYAMRIRRPMLLHDFLASRPRGVFGDVEGVSQQFSAMSKVVVEKFGSLRYIRNETTVVVGPEGGFSAGELEMLMSQLTPMSFSDGILRVETAAIAGLAIVKSMINN